MRRRTRAPHVGTFASLRVPNFRVWFVGQCISMVGYFIQVVALAILVLDLTGNGTVVGLITALHSCRVSSSDRGLVSSPTESTNGASFSRHNP